ncbi:MAG: ParA family protein [Acidimicrobiia bacterium]
MIVIAVYNSKGGVGKTATTVNLGYLAALHGHRTLVWDLDPQGAATFYFRVRHRLKGGPKALTSQRHRIGDRIRGTDYELLDVLPSDRELRNVDLAFDASKHRTGRLRRVVDELRAEPYDLLLIDCPPSSSLLAENVFEAADVLLVPVVPTTLSVRTLHQLDETLAGLDPPRPRVLVFFSMVDGRKNLHAELMTSLRGERGDVADSFIPSATEVELMGASRTPVGVSAPASVAATAYEQLWGELVARGYTDPTP